MRKINGLWLGGILVLLFWGWYVFQEMTDDTYKGMSFIPEKHEDIPLFEGLKPTEHEYVLSGNHWTDIYEFYVKELPKLDWTKEFEDSALEDHDKGNDWSGFYSGWRKEGFDGQLTIAAQYNQFEDQTEVSFDHLPIYTTTTWISSVPESICIYKSSNEEKCSQITDETTIKGIIGYINNAIDWKEEVLPREKSSVIEIRNLEIKVHYGNEKEIYFQSQKGTKLMKPEPEFFKLINLSQ